LYWVKLQWDLVRNRRGQMLRVCTKPFEAFEEQGNKG
jgi:hypothetical protein